MLARRGPDQFSLSELAETAEPLFLAAATGGPQAPIDIHTAGADPPAFPVPPVTQTSAALHFNRF